LSIAVAVLNSIILSLSLLYSTDVILFLILL